ARPTRTPRRRSSPTPSRTSWRRRRRKPRRPPRSGRRPRAAPRARRSAGRSPRRRVRRIDGAGRPVCHRGMPVARSAVVALAVAVAVRAGAATCPPDGFDAILCALTDVQGDGCAPRALARLATRSAKAVAAAQAADAKGRARRAHASLQRARDVLFTLEIRGQRLVARGRLDAGCYAGMAVTIEGALAGLAALQFGTTTTTAPPGPTTTTITTTTTVPGATSTTVTTTTTST